jgi:NADH:ubiquinone oxidoreductase subunit
MFSRRSNSTVACAVHCANTGCESSRARATRTHHAVLRKQNWVNVSVSTNLAIVTWRTMRFRTRAIVGWTIRTSVGSTTMRRKCRLNGMGTYVHAHVHMRYRHKWLHHSTDKTPYDDPHTQHRWLQQHDEMHSHEPSKLYYPYSTTRTKIDSWQPKQMRDSSKP